MTRSAEPRSDPASEMADGPKRGGGPKGRKGSSARTSDRRDATFAKVKTIRNERGLHARAAAKFVNLAGGFDAEVFVAKGGQTVSGLSIMGLMMLAAGPDNEIEIRTTGPQAEEALEALCAMIINKFEED
tara:strand:+ start:196 stop:585 length:390 start_codon:yes stop_codon:yes gene_type:complete